MKGLNKKRNHNQAEQGFTLVEVMVAGIIMGGVMISVEVLYIQRKYLTEGDKKYIDTQEEYRINNLGTNDEGNDMIFRIRSKYWNKDTRLRTRCIRFSAGSGHLFDGSWSYTNSKCFPKCPEGHNCNGAQDNADV